MAGHGYRNESELKVHKIRGPGSESIPPLQVYTSRAPGMSWAACWQEAVNLRLTDDWGRVTCAHCLRLHNQKS